MSYNHNALGKTPYVCSCGVRANLEDFELLDWQMRHSSQFSNVQHKIQKIGDPIGSTPSASLEDLVSALQAIAQPPGGKK
jgi:hypothetical protein